MISLLMAALVSAAAGGGVRPNAEAILGTWTNPKESVVVRTVPCGSGVCGTVIWATAETEEKARRAGTLRLRGKEVLRGQGGAEDGHWQGRVFIPKLGETVSAEIVQLSRDELQITGCKLKGLLCRKQVWRRTASQISRI